MDHGGELERGRASSTRCGSGDLARAVAGAVVVWCADVPPTLEPHDLETLSPPERLRVDHAATPEEAIRRATAYALARRAVALTLGVRAVDLDRTCSRCGRSHGRPRVVTDAGLHLSVSHARTPADDHGAAPVVVAALTRLAPVGIDLLFTREAAFDGFDAVARHRDDAPTPDCESRARLWARKEAVLKAIGLGLDVDPASFPAPGPGSVTLIGPDRLPVAVADLELARSAVASTEESRSLVGAVALARDDPSVPVVTAASL